MSGCRSERVKERNIKYLAHVISISLDDHLMHCEESVNPLNWKVREFQFKPIGDHYHFFLDFVWIAFLSLYIRK